jgi:hypothetical protein
MGRSSTAETQVGAMDGLIGGEGRGVARGVSEEDKHGDDAMQGKGGEKGVEVGKGS